MKIFRNDRSYETRFDNVEDYYTAARDGFKEKADHNKHESQSIFYLILLFTLLTPLFVTLGEGWFWGKAVPAGLSVLAASGSGWLQLRKPQRLWAIYRRAQRELEKEMVAYKFGLDKYQDNVDKQKVFAATISEVSFRAHEQWEGLVPEPDVLVSQTPALPKEAPKSLS